MKKGKMLKWFMLLAAICILTTTADCYAASSKKEIRNAYLEQLKKIKKNIKVIMRN